MNGDELVYSCHRDLRRVYFYHINFNLYAYKLSTNNLCTNLWSNPFSYLFKGQTKERKECINVKGFFSPVKENYFLWVSVLNQQAKLHAHKWP